MNHLRNIPPVFVSLFGVIICALFSSYCHRGPDRAEANPGLSIMVNAVAGGVNSQVAEWLDQELPAMENELGVPVKFLPAGLNEQDFKARVALDRPELEAVILDRGPGTGVSTPGRP